MHIMPLTIVATGEPEYRADEAVSWLLNHVDDWRERTERPRRDPGRFHPSDLGASDDEIAARYAGTAAPETFDAQKLRIFDNGHGVHARWGRYLKKSGLSVRHTKSFWMPRLRMKGTCDEIIATPEWTHVIGDGGMRPDAGELHIVELKSINPFGFGALVAPHESHVDQLHCYMAGLRIYRGILLYESKGDQRVKLFDVPFDEARWLAIEARLLRLRREGERMAQERSERLGPDVIAASEALIAEMERVDGALPENDVRRAAAVAKAKLMV